MNSNTLLINYVTVPQKIDIKEFFESEFYKNDEGTTKGLFEKYRDNLINFSDCENEKDRLSGLYIPKPYFIFGHYDLALLTLVDDFTVGTRIFSPVHTYKDTPDNYTYDYQVISGTGSNKGLKPALLKSIINNVRNFPWISICRIKVNNGLLIGTGIDTIERIISIIDEETKNISNVEVSSFGSFDCYEITSVCFSETFSSLKSFVNKLEHLNVRKFNQKYVKKLLQNSPLGEHYKNGDQIEKFNNSHIFSSLNPTIGIDLECIKDVSNFIDNETVKLTSYIDVKPGHYFPTKELLKEDGFNDIETCVGNHSLKIIKDWKTDSIIDLPFFVLNTKSVFYNHINKIKTLISYSKEDEDDKDNEGSHCSKDGHPYYLTDTLRNSRYFYKTEQLVNIRKSLCKIGVSKALTDRFLKIINEYNKSITNVHLYSYFIELSGFLNRLFTEISNGSSELIDERYLEELHVKISSSIRYFERAYFCRHDQGYESPQLISNSIEYNGGIQSLLSAFNEVYVSYINLLSFQTRKINDAFVNISGDETISSSPVRLKVNYFHLFNPEFFFSVIVKESINGFQERLKIEEKEEFNQVKTNVKSELLHFFNTININDPFLKKCLIDYTKKDLINYVIIDYWTYKYAYNSNIALFYHWYFATLISTPEIYSTDKKPNDKQFISLSFRLLIIVSLYEDNPDEIIETIINNPFDSILNDQWVKFLIPIANIIRRNGIINPKNNEKSKIIPILIKTKDFAIDNYGKWCIVEMGYEKREFNDNEINERISQREKTVSELSKEYMTKLTNGKVIPYNNSIYPTVFITSLSIAYLTLCTPDDMSPFYRESSKTIPTKFVLSRNEEGTPSVGLKTKKWNESKDYYFPYLFDVQGGVFLISNKSRENYLKIRGTLFASLFDFALKYKNRYFTKTYNNH